MTELRDSLQAALGGVYVLDRELSGAGMSRVYMAREPGLDRAVALKVLPPELTGAVSAERFAREIHLVARLQHPHIVPVLSAGNANGMLYYTMPFIEGESLRARLARESRIPLPQAARIAREVADALDYAHHRGIVHRDIKPENILLGGYSPHAENGDGWHALVTDFGIARALGVSGYGPGSTLTRTGAVVGTPAYMSPEQFTATGDVTAASDIYSLGCVLYEMLTGQLPPRAAFAEARLGDLPSEMHGILRSMLAADPDRRTATAREVAIALNAVHAVDRGAAAGGGVLPFVREHKWRVAAAAIAVVLSAAYVTRRNTPVAPGHGEASHVVAVVPFDVLDDRLALWREGMVDVLSRNLDGAGPLRAVPPTTVIRRWSARGDVTTASALALRSGAALAVFGSLMYSGSDSIRATAAIVDAQKRRKLGDVEVRGHVQHLDRLTDSLAVALLRELGRHRVLTVGRLTSVDFRSLPALKAFLMSEQFFRRGNWDSAKVYADQAAALDPNSALALRRAGYALWFSEFSTANAYKDRGSSSSAFQLVAAYWQKAGALNHGLAPRDSLLILADSLFATLEGTSARNLGRVRRLRAVLQQATQRYPDDAEAWYQLGEAQVHLLFSGPVNQMAALERSIELDSTFTPAFAHLLELAPAVRGADAARRYLRAYLWLVPGDTGYQLVSRIMDPAWDWRDAKQQLNNVSARTLFEAAEHLRHWPDSSESAARLVKVALARENLRAPYDAEAFRPLLMQTLASRGRLREAYAAGLRPPYHSYVDGAVLGVLPRAEADRQILTMLRSTTWSDVFASLAWYASVGDTARLREALGRFETESRSQTNPDWLPAVIVGAQLVRADLALLRADTAEAIRRLASVPDSLCTWWCTRPWTVRSQLLRARGRYREARFPPDHAFVLLPRHVLHTLEWARASEALGATSDAMMAYAFVAEAWRNADPELQPYVAEARKALKRLGVDRPRGSELPASPP